MEAVKTEKKEASISFPKFTKEEMEKNKEKVKSKLKLNSILKTADKFADITFSKLVSMTKEELKKYLKTINVPYYEVNIKDIGKEEIDENGNLFNPIASFLNKNTEIPKILLINIDKPLKKRDFVTLRNIKIFREIGKEEIPHNVLVVLNDRKDFFEKYKKTLSYGQKQKFLLVFSDLLKI